MNEFTQLLLDGIRRYGAENIVINVNKKEGTATIDRTNITQDSLTNEYTLDPLDVIRTANTLEVQWREVD